MNNFPRYISKNLSDYSHMPNMSTAGLYVLIFFLLPLVITCLSLACHFRNQASRTNEPKEPITPPYWVRGASHLCSILFDTESFLRRLQSRCQYSIISLSSAVPVYFAFPGEATKDLFRSSRDLVPAPSLLDALTVFFGLTSDREIFQHDNISAFEIPLGEHTSHPDPSRRIMEHQRKDFATYLNGEHLGSVMTTFTDIFTKSLWPEADESRGAIALPDLYLFIRNRIFRAEVEALYGEHIFSICPSLCDDFWAFYDAFPVISRQLPQWLFPAHYSTRRKMLLNLHIWRTWCNSASERTSNDGLIWGTSYIRRMVQRHEDLGFSDDGISSVMLGYLTTSNTVPATAWMILHVFLDQSLTARLRHELYLNPQNSVQTILLELGRAPLVNSVYREVLRLHVAGTVGRKSYKGKFSFPSGLQILAGIPLMSANWLGGLDSSFWNTGRLIDGFSEYPVENFWAERFLKYPGDPMSGPVRSATKYEHLVGGRTGQKTAQDDSNARLVTSGIREHWFPFGGGAWKCPGETLATSTILLSFFIVLRELDIEFLDHKQASRVRTGHRTLPFGSHAFSKPVAVRIKRRLREE
ncbi:Nacht and ankyrin domain protein [Colletotrichum scovillei]|uniref:Nacht and ankyrin domain protein n=1 Tax=Colletotrichum scovillei TaxID=1209932 RepID=A0A9P7QQC8_9PEZI|nr:Nacht and ankyrin domain protein [Colletotrichum scovillei]KAG7040613.1 Nacht and ankyrin domain protein [Colletotrichum scovillei]KAG7060660.1 Nacht and ankyrin domain protein [Colletotrichum scovillei]